jgi:hypothetical protein
MLRGISNTGHFGRAKQCVINAFDTSYLLSVDEVMASILNLAHNMDEDVIAPGLPGPDGPAPPSMRFSLLVAVHTVAADTSHVAHVVVVAYLTSATPVVA